MKILRTRENGRPHPRAKEKLGSLSHPFRVTAPFSFSFLSRLSPSSRRSFSFFLSRFLSSPTRARALARTRAYYGHVLTWTPTSPARTGGPAGTGEDVDTYQGVVGVHRTLAKGLQPARLSGQKLVFSPATSFAFLAPTAHRRQLLRRRLARRQSSSSSVQLKVRTILSIGALDTAQRFER